MASLKLKRGSEHSDDDGEVGYRRPPKKHQFRKGEPSRNPCGRRGKPKVGPPAATIEPDFLDELVPIVIDGKRRQVTREDFLDHVLFKEAAKGDVKAIRALSDRRILREKRLSMIARSLVAEVDAPVSAEDEALIARAMRRALRRDCDDEPDSEVAGEQEAGDECAA